MKRNLLFALSISLFSILFILGCNKDDDTDSSFVCGTSTIKDVDGNVYETVLIGDQCWMAENLKTTKYRNNIPIEHPGFNKIDWQNNSTGAYAWYDNIIDWKDSYGALYNWHAVNNSNGLCPSGWHIPSDAEWKRLLKFFASAGYPNEGSYFDEAGNALKSCRQAA